MCIFCIVGAFCTFVVLPALVGFFGVRGLRRGRRWWQKTLGASALGAVALYGAAVVYWVAWMGPWRGGIVAQGVLPEGREYCVVQTFKDVFEPFQVSFYLRDPTGKWRWHYLEHEDGGWRSASVAVAGEAVQVRRDGVLFRELALASPVVNPDPNVADELACPASYSVAEVRAFHDRYFRSR